MNKGIELTQSQIKAYESGATMFLFPIDMRLCYRKGLYISNSKGNYINTLLLEGDDLCEFYINRFLQNYVELPIQEGDKEVFIKGKSGHSFTKCSNTLIIKVQDIPTLSIPKITAREQMLYSFYNEQMQEQNIDRTYEDNDYIFLAEFERED